MIIIIFAYVSLLNSSLIINSLGFWYLVCLHVKLLECSFKKSVAEIHASEIHRITVQGVSFFSDSVLDLNAFERQNKAEGLGMVTEEGSSK